MILKTVRKRDVSESAWNELSGLGFPCHTADAVRVSYRDYARITKGRIAEKELPSWVVAFIKSLAHPDDKGMGDTVSRHTKAAKAVLKALGIKCRCDIRRIELNRKYPYHNDL